MLKLSKKSYVHGLPSLSGKPEGVCGACQIGKQTRTAHNATKFIGTNRILKLMHMDLVGPMSTHSIGGKKYILVLVDDFSRYTWVDFLVAKSDAFDSFSKICSKIQNEKKDKVVRLRIDHGTEFENASFHDFCNTNGIAHELSAPITPQQNGVVECKNRVLIEMGRVMLNAANLAKHFWAEAIGTTCYTLNRVYLIPSTSTTPYELWKGKKPNVSHLRIFGSICYIYKDRDLVGKFDARSDIGTFLGYSLNSRAYRVYNHRTKIVMESINVVIDDCKTYEPFDECVDIIVPQSSSNVKEASTIDHSDIDIQDHIATTVETSNTSSQVQHPGAKQVQRDHQVTDIIGDLNVQRMTRSQKAQLTEEISYLCYVSHLEPKKCQRGCCGQ